MEAKKLANTLVRAIKTNTEQEVAFIKRNNHNMWDAFKRSVNLHGYKYYDIPPELRYRYPSPGSCTNDVHNQPHLFKQHWKLPFRDSRFNIRPIEKRLSWDEDTEQWLPRLPQLDPENPNHQVALMEQQSDWSSCKPCQPADPGSEESIKQLWDLMEQAPEIMKFHIEHISPYSGDLESDYNQVFIDYNPRGFSGFENDAKSKQIFVELEHWIENIIGAKQIKEKKIQMYKGTVKKWQVLDDNAHDRDQIEKMQAAIQAPLPEELEMYKEKHSKPMQLPFTNENVTAWRDEPLAVESADFNPQQLQLDRERRRTFFIERNEQPKQLQE